MDRDWRGAAANAEHERLQLQLRGLVRHVVIALHRLRLWIHVHGIFSLLLRFGIQRRGNASQITSAWNAGSSSQGGDAITASAASGVLIDLAGNVQSAQTVSNSSNAVIFGALRASKSRDAFLFLEVVLVCCFPSLALFRCCMFGLFGVFSVMVLPSWCLCSHSFLRRCTRRQRSSLDRCHGWHNSNEQRTSGSCFDCNLSRFSRCTFLSSGLSQLSNRFNLLS